MKFSNAVLCFVLTSAAVEGFVTSRTPARQSTLQLEAHHQQDKNRVGAAFGAAAVGWSLATQMAFAAMAPPTDGKQADLLDITNRLVSS